MSESSRIGLPRMRKSLRCHASAVSTTVMSGARQHDPDHPLEIAVESAAWTNIGEPQPIGGGVGKILKLGGKQPANLSMHGYYNVEKPTDGPEWQLQFTFMLMFPR